MYNIQVLEQCEFKGEETKKEFAERLNKEFEAIENEGFLIQIFSWTKDNAGNEVVYFNVNTIEEQLSSQMKTEKRKQEFIKKMAPRVQNPGNIRVTKSHKFKN